MAQITNCLKLISRMPESDQDALVSRLDELQALGIPAQRAQVQAAIDLMSRLEREANPQGIQRSAARDVTETPEFRSWFGDSKVVDAEGRPLVVYHATTSDIKKFSTKKSAGGFYFTPNAEDAYPSKRGEMTSERGLNVMPAYLAINSPLRTSDPADWHRLDADRRSSIEDRGFDGVIVENEDGSVREYIAFEPSQIKSAIGNRGTFDPADADITRSASRLPAGVEIVEVDDGFDAMKDGKRIGRLRDNLPRGAAEQLDENASVDIVKVENEFKGQGVGAALYDAFYEKHGGRIAPSGKTSPEAWALWKRKFPEKVDAFIEAEAGRIRDGADPMMVVRNITDPEVARSVSEAAGDVVIRSASRQTDTPEFKRWFGDSKVVDANGKPLVVYHGTNVGINEFKPSKGLRSAGGLFESSATSPFKFFSPDKDEAQSYANAKGGHLLYSVYLRMERPLDATTPDGLVRMHRLFGSLDDTELSDWADSAVDLLEGIDELRATTPAEKSYFVKRDAKGRVIGQRATEREGYILEKYTAEDHAAEIEHDLAQLIAEYEALLSAMPSSDAPLSVWAALDEPDSGDRLRAAGFDGLVFHENDGKKTFAVLDSTQIKSATGNRGTFDPADPDITRSATRPEFFSQLERAVAAVPDRLATMAAPQWKLWLDANAPKLGVKKDEIEWSGIKDYLTLRGKDKVTRDELVAYLADSGVRVQETMLGGDAAEKITLIRERTRRDAWGEVVVYRSSNGAFVVENGIGGQNWSVQDADSYDSDYQEDDGGYAGSFSSREAVESFINGQTRAADPDYSGVGSNPATKYGQYTVPGGERYREVLITLPGEVSVAARIAALKAREISRKMRSAESDEEYEALRKERAVISGKAKEDPGYKSSHWDQLNILAHLRIDDRTDADGRSVLFINEIQSDWSSDGRKKGFGKPSMKGEVRRQEGYNAALADEWESADSKPAESWAVYWEDGTYSGGYETRAAAEERLRGAAAQKSGSVPRGPFVEDTKAYATLALKRAIMMAVEDGHDRVAFITGQQAADLYDLSKRVDMVSVSPAGPNHYDLTVSLIDGGKRYFQGQSPEEVADTIGKELAERAIKASNDWVVANKAYRDELRKDDADEAELNRLRAARDAIDTELTGGNLVVGGEGMRAFYDQIIPQVARDVLKKLGGGRMEMVSIGESNDGKFVILKPDGTPHSGTAGVVLFPSRASAQAAANKLNRSQGLGHKPAPAPVQGGEQPGFDITPAMREKVMAGVPLFSRRRGWDAFPDAIIATPPSTQSGDPSYATAKGGDMKAALELVDRVMPDDIEQRVRATIGDARPIVAAVHAEEAAGRNKIPLATAFVLGERMGLQVDEKLVQASRAKRTGSDGMARLGVQPEFAGEVERGADYLLVDDTLAQGGTLAQLKTHIEDNGGRVVGVFALSGKQYSAKISLDNATLNDVRAKYGSIEGWWKGELGYGFEGLTKSEARYMLNSRLSPEALRDRVAAARQAAGAGDGAQRSASVGDQEVVRSMPRVPGLNAGPVESTTGDYGREYTPQQLAMFKNTGRTTQKPSLVERLKEARKDFGKKMAQGIVDQFRPLRDLGGNAYTLARLSKGAAGAFEALLGHGKLKIVDGAYDADTSGGFIDTVGKPLGREIEDFMWWVAANRADSLSLQDRENLFTDDDIAAGKSLADGDLEFDYLLQSGATTRDRKAAYEDSLKKFNAFGKNVLDIAEESGLIDGESRKLWESEFYVPFYRVSEEDGSFIGAKIKGGLARQRAFHELKGGSQKLNSDLLANTMRNWAHLIDASAKNRAAKATLESAQNVGIALEADAETVRQLGKSMGGKGGTVWFMDGGQQRHFLVGDPYVLEAINSLEYAGLRGPLMDALSTMKHWLTVGVTASPAFKIRNLIRDSIQAISLSGLSYNPVTNLVEGYKATDRASQDYVSTLASGGLIRFGSMLEDSASERVRRLVKKGVDGNTILDSESKVQAFYGKYLEPAIEAYQEIGNRGEEINRASLYKQLRANGVSHAEASLMARDLMDFSMQGTWTSVRFLTQVVPFMNARLQGMYKLGRGAMEDPRRFAIVTGAVALTSISLLAAYGDDDDWKKREDWDRDGFWWFKFGGTAFRIPKPFEIGAIGSLAERGVELFTNDEFTAKRFGSRVLHLLGDNLAMNPIPQAVKPMLDIYANKDSFSGRPIESMGMERLQSEYRYNVHTSMIARGASSALNAATRTVGAEALSPVQIDSLIRGYFGWLGTFVVAGADMAVRPLTDEPTRPQADYLKVVSQGFLKTLPEPGSKYVSAMYDQAKVIEQAYATHRQMVKEGKVDEASEFAAENKDLLERYRRIEGVKEAQSKINKRVREIELSDMDPARKAEEIQKLRDQSDKIARKVY